jgi:hypothetical protein
VAILNITYGGRSADLGWPVDDRITDAEVVRVAVEVLRSGSLRGLHEPSLGSDAFRRFVVDRLTGSDGTLRLYLRPKVPFGC